MSSCEIPDDLLDRARQGHPGALEDLWERCAPIVKAAVDGNRGIGGSDADELAQEAAVLLLDLLGSPTYGLSPAAGFADRFARALHWQIQRYLRRERRRQHRETTDDFVVLEQTLAKHAAGASSAGRSGRALRRALERLSPRQRAVIAGLYEREVTVAALAAEQQVSPQAISALHRRALETLRRLLTEEGHG